MVKFNKVCNDADHSRIRRLLSHAFSESALREQEPLVTRYFDLLVKKLHDQARHPEHCTVNIVKWYNFTTFDVLGDLCFDEPFGALAKGQYHSWIANLFQGIKVRNMFGVLRAYPIVGNVIFALFRLFPQATRAVAEHKALTAHKTDQRLERQTDRRDFMRFVYRLKGEHALITTFLVIFCAITTRKA